MVFLLVHVATLLLSTLDKAARRLLQAAYYADEKAAKRMGLIIALTYNRPQKKNSRLARLPTTEAAGRSVKAALEAGLYNKSKASFDTRLVTDVVGSDDPVGRLDRRRLKREIKEFCREADSQAADAVFIMLIGHGDKQVLKEVKSKERTDSAAAAAAADIGEHKDVANETDAMEGRRYQEEYEIPEDGGDVHIKEGGYFFYSQDDEPVYRSDILKLVCGLTKGVRHRIVVLDCCRGDKGQQQGDGMGGGGAEVAGEQDGGRNRKLFVEDGPSLERTEYENTYILSSTLPDHAAWVTASSTQFSAELARLISRAHLPFSSFDEEINRCMRKNHRKPQMAEMTKWVTEPFEW